MPPFNIRINHYEGNFFIQLFLQPRRTNLHFFLLQHLESVSLNPSLTRTHYYLLVFHSQRSYLVICYLYRLHTLIATCQPNIHISVHSSTHYVVSEVSNAEHRCFGEISEHPSHYLHLFFLLYEFHKPHSIGSSCHMQILAH